MSGESLREVLNEGRMKNSLKIRLNCSLVLFFRFCTREQLEYSRLFCGWVDIIGWGIVILVLLPFLNNYYFLQTRILYLYLGNVMNQF